MKSSYRKEAVSGVKWTSISSILIAGGSFLLILILTNILDKSDFGLFAIVNVVVGFSAEFVDAGISQAIIQKPKISKNQLSTLYWLNIILGGFVFLVVFGTSPFIASFYDDIRLENLLKWISISFIFTGLGAQYQAILLKNTRYKIIAYIDVISFMAYLGSTLLFAYYDQGVYSLIWGNLIRSFLSSFLSILAGFKNHIPKLYFSLAGVKPFLTFGSFRTGSFLINFVSSQLDSILIGKFLGVAELGVYDVLKRLAIQPIKFINPVIQKVTYPLLAKVHFDKKRITSMFLKILDLLNLIRFPIFIGIALCAEPLTELFLGEDWSVHYRVLQVLCFVYLFSTIQSFVGQSMVASGKANWGFYNNILQFPLNLLAIYLGSFWGILGIASALLIKSFIILLPRYYFIIKKLYLISLRKYLEVIFKDLILILVPAIFINLFVSYLSLAPLMSLLLMGGAFLIVLFVVYLIFEKEQIKYVKSLI